MNGEILYDALGEIREEFIQDAEAAGKKSHRSPFRSLIAAVLALCVLALPVSAEVQTGYISNLLAPFYGEAQTELVDSIGVPIDASVTVNGYTLTADAVIGDRYNIAIVYSLTREDGGLFPKYACFDDVGVWDTAGSGYYSHQLSEDKTVLKILSQWTSHRRLFFINRNHRAVFHDLIIREDGKETLLAEGTWELDFVIRYEDTTKSIPCRGLQITDEQGNVYQMKRLQLSPFGIHADMKAPNPYLKGLAEKGITYQYPIEVAILLADGTEVVLDDASMGHHGKTEGETFQVQYDNMFDEPIPVDTIKAIRICDTVVPVD